MKTMFVLGAGASQMAGAPLMSDFLDRAYDLLRTKTTGVIDAKDQFEDVFNAISELQGVHSKAFLDLNNIEIVFGAIEMGLLLKRLGTRDEASITKLRDSLITLIYKTLEFGIRFPVIDRKIRPPRPYDAFMTTLDEVEKKQPPQDPHEFSFVTFNYDLCLDYALYHYGRSYDYSLDAEAHPHTCPLLKLHGSINWDLSENGKIVPFEVRDARFQLLGEQKYVFYNLGTMLSERNFEDKPLNGPPVIVPPSWNKNGYHGQLSNVWSRAAYEFAAAENIFIIGYSLPETDSFFRYLYALGSESKARLRNLVIINKDDSGSVEARFRQLIGRGVESRFMYIPATFGNGLSRIKDILVNP
ncbi:MAG: SIR2 family protein [Deltaproteobacteria bacterium]|nr:SIR2 family protein [Deltaproteobacteria bacterium]